MRGHKHSRHHQSVGHRRGHGRHRRNLAAPPRDHQQPADPSPEMQQPAVSPRSNQREILVDAANVAFTNHNQPGDRGSVENILKMQQALIELGYRPIFIADASLKYAVDHPEALTRLEQSGQILEAPAGTEADYFLLAYSEREGLPIVSNDIFRDRRAEFPRAVRRRVPFMIVDGEVIIDRERLRRIEQAA